MSPNLLSVHYSDSNERAHFWLPDSELTSAHDLLNTPLTERMYIDQGEVVRVRVEADEFYDDEPGPPKASEGVQIRREPRRPPYTIVVSYLTCDCHLDRLLIVDLREFLWVSFGSVPLLSKD